MGILEDQIVVVAGVGPGLGRSIAVQAAKAGADVVLAARTESRLADGPGCSRPRSPSRPARS